MVNIYLWWIIRLLLKSVKLDEVLECFSDLISFNRKFYSTFSGMKNSCLVWGTTRVTRFIGEYSLSYYEIIQEYWQFSTFVPPQPLQDGSSLDSLLAVKALKRLERLCTFWCSLSCKGNKSAKWKAKLGECKSQNQVINWW